MNKNGEDQALVLRDNARQQLQQIKDVESGIEYLNKVKAIEVWVKAEKKDAELQNMVAEQKLRTQRILGQLIKKGQEAKEIATRKSDMGNQYTEVVCTTGEHSSQEPEFVKVYFGNKPVQYPKPKTLSEIGLTRKESSTFQIIASIPDDIFEEAIIEKKQAVDKAVGELTTASMLQVAMGIKKPHILNNSGENEWYTPKNIIEAARLTMGSIDLDPASSELADKTVHSTMFYTKEDDGLAKEWAGNVWMNPPYAQPLITHFAEKLVSELQSGMVQQAIVLVNNATDTAWFHSLVSESSVVCFTKSRVKFIDMNGNPSGGPLQGQAILYFGKDNVDGFVENFSGIGFILHNLSKNGI